MASRQSISYLYRLFIPTTLVMWVTIIFMSVWQYHQEKNMRIESVKTRVDFVNKRLIDAYDKGSDLNPFIGFLQNYFKESSMADISVSLYDTSNGQLLYSVGNPLPPLDPKSANGDLIFMRGAEMNRIASQHGTHVVVDPSKAFYLSTLRSNDGKVVAHAVLPYTDNLNRYLRINPFWWFIILALAVAATAVSFLTSLHIARNIKLLRKFADSAANDSNFIPISEFPNDELGEISRQIITIYNGRTQAVVDRESEHRIALRTIEEKSQLKRTLTNNINHELKTPVGIIKGYLDTLIDNPDIDEESRNHFLQKASQNMNRLVELLNNLSTITRLDESGNTIPLEEVDFHEFVTDLAEDFRESGTLGSMTLLHNIPLDCYVKGNQSLLTSVLTNIIKNAVAYSQGTKIKLEMVECGEQFYTFSFADNGTGLDESHFAHLFERFYRVDSGRARKSGGTGLGLAIVKSAINTMGGSITVRNRVGGGLEYLFTLQRSKLSDK